MSLAWLRYRSCLIHFQANTFQRASRAGSHSRLPVAEERNRALSSGRLAKAAVNADRSLIQPSIVDQKPRLTTRTGFFVGQSLSRQQEQCSFEVAERLNGMPAAIRVKSHHCTEAMRHLRQGRLSPQPSVR